MTDETMKWKPIDVIGTTGLKHDGGGNIDEEWLPSLQNDKGIKVYQEMRDNDPIIGAILYAIRTLIRQTKWEIVPTDETPEHIELADFVTSCFNDMSTTPEDFLSEVLSFLPFGWSFFEIVYKLRKGKTGESKTNSDYNDGKIGWRKFSIRAQTTLHKWELDAEGGVQGFWQSAPPKYELRYIPIEKGLLFRTETHKGNPEGRSILRNAYRSWWFLKRMQEVESVGVERDLAGLPVMQVPLELLSPNATAPQKQVLNAFRDLIQRVRRDEYEGIVIPSETDADGNPSGYKLSLLTSGGRRPIDVNEIIKRYESRIAMSTLGEFVFLGVDSAGSFALASNKTALFSQALGTYLQGISAVFNNFALPRLMRLNGYSDPSQYPKLIFRDIEQADLNEISAALSNLTNSGILTPDDDLEKWVRDYANLPLQGSGELPEGVPTRTPRRDEEGNEQGGNDYGSEADVEERGTSRSEEEEE